MQMASVNGIAIHYRDEGPSHAPALVFVNSLGTDFRIWDGVVEALGERFRMIRYDKRGHGLSDAPPAPYEMSDHVSDLEALLDMLGAGEVVAVGIAAIKDVVMERWFSPSFRRSQPAALSVCSNMLVRQPVSGYSGTCAALRDTDNTELVKALKMPVLLLVGSNDGSTPPDLVRSTHDLIPGSRFVVLDGPGHIPCVEAPEETARLIGDFAAGG
ncbi:MAG: alpha/beta fold hydrolase [Nitratireductor sp.]|nr:alpha/beta fold hydrolase [Nitratireductor sp.]